MRKIRWDAEKRDIVFRSLIGLAMLFGTVLLQTSFLSQIDIFGAVPDLLLIFVVALGLFDGLRVAAPAGVAAGVLCYYLGGGEPLGILFYAVVAILASRQYPTRNYQPYCIYMTVAGVLKICWTLFATLVYSPVWRPFRVLWRSALPEFLGTVVFALALYVPLRVAARLLKRKSEM
jgi:rod shape-determining protein MreD